MEGNRDNQQVPRGDNRTPEAFFAEIKPIIIVRIHDTARKSMEIQENRGKTGLNQYVDDVLEIIAICGREMVATMPEEVVQSRRWPEVRQWCVDFVQEQCQWLLARCRETWEDDADLIEIRFYQLRNKIISEIEQQMSLLHQEKRKKQFDKAIKKVPVKITADAKRLLLFSAGAFLLGFILGKIL